MENKINVKQLKEDLQSVLSGHKLTDEITITGSLLFDLIEYLKENDCLNSGESAAEHKFYASDKTASFKKTANILLGDYDKAFNIEQVDIEKL